MSIEQEIRDGLNAAFKNTPIDTTGAEFMGMGTPSTPPVETPIETPPVVNEPVSSLNSETTVVDTPPTDTNTEITPSEPVSPPVVTKSFEELLAEKTAGKFKSWEDVENIVNTPKEEFANDYIKKLNDFAKKGIELNSEFFELQNKDFENMEDPLQVMTEAFRLKPEYKGLSPKVLEFELNKKYNLKEWQDKLDSDLTEEDEVYRELLLRDAQNDKDWLISYKNERILSKEPDPEQARLADEQKATAQLNWERFVDEELANKTSKLSMKIDDKETFDYDVSAEDKKYASDMMKSMTKDINVFWNQFADKDGKINQKDVFEAILHLKNKNNITKVAYQNALAKGKESEIKNIKNVTFEPNATPSPTKVDWRQKAIDNYGKNH